MTAEGRFFQILTKAELKIMKLDSLCDARIYSEYSYVELIDYSSKKVAANLTHSK